MTEQEISKFFEQDNVRIGDTIRFSYSYGMFPQIIRGKLYSKEFVLGGRVINTKLGPLNLPEPKNYLILHNNLNGLFAVSANYISDLELESRRAINANEFNQFVNDNNIRKDDEVIIIEVDNRLLKTKIYDPQLKLDEDGDEYFLLYLDGEIQMFFLQAIGEIIKPKK
jgi:hypothetical protein